MTNMKISSPWVTYFHQLDAMFGDDPDIRILCSDDCTDVKLYVNGEDKANALTKLLPAEKNFGHVTMKITVIPSNLTSGKAELFRKAFDGNPLYDETIVVQPEWTNNPFTYVMFKPFAVQYWNDNLGDPHGNVTTLAQDLARELFQNQEGVYFSTSDECE